MQNAPEYDRVRRQILWATAGVFLAVALGAWLITWATLDNRTATFSGARDSHPVSEPVGVGTPVKASVADFSVKLDRSTAPAGKITFRVANIGPSFHEFVILKTDHAAGNLPIIKQEGYRRAAEDKKGDLNVSELGGIKVGSSKDLTTSLKPGHYVIVCNLPMHYRLGMRTAFTVK